MRENVCVLQLEESLTSISESGFDLRVYERKNYSDLGRREESVLKRGRKGGLRHVCASATSKKKAVGKSATYDRVLCISPDGN